MLRETYSGKTLATFPHPDGVRAVALTPDGRTLVTSCRDKKVRIWDVADVKERLALPVKEVQRQISVHPDGRSFLLIEGEWIDGQKMAVIDVATGKSKFQIDCGKGIYLECAIHSADGRWILTSDNHGSVVVWNASDGKAHASYGRMFGYSALAFDPHREIAATSSSMSRKVHFARLCLTDPTDADKAKIQSLLGELDSDDPTVRERATAALIDLGFLARAAVKRAATEAASAEVRMRARWIREKVDEGRLELFPELPTSVGALAFSPDGRSLACGCDNGWTYVWDLETRKETGRFRD
jgi:WD40 repeat protein